MSETAQAGAEERRCALMALLARAPAKELKRLWSEAGMSAEAEPVRGPETGLVTVRGRMGGAGAAFNLGEATVTRATVKLAGGAVGHAYALGRDREKAWLCAIIDAIGQEGGERAAAVETCILEPIRLMLADAEMRGREETAATKVDFFTVARGED